MAARPIDTFRREIEQAFERGDATEHTHRPALKTLIESLGHGVTATNEPKRVECGAPDFVISSKSPHGPVTLGYIEAKDIGKPLDEVERSEQLKRYLAALPNLILTDYLEFRWYVSGERRHSARLARARKTGKLAPEKDGPQAVSDLLSGFLAQAAEPINDPKALALRMARLTHLIRDMIVTAFERNSASATLRDLHRAFEAALIPDLQVPQFADMFAQTLAYGLFAARCNHHGPRGAFKRLGSASEIPKTNPFLRQLFETITGTALDDEPYAGFVDDLAQLLADTDINAVLADFGKRTARQDPVVHFYETFLAAYDPKLRESRGVYYTPEPVVSYLVRSVDYLLKARFNCPKGLAESRGMVSGTGVPPVETHGQDAHMITETHGQDARATTHATPSRVLILDPACGTGTFLYAVVDHIRAEFMRQGNAGMWSGYVRNHLLPRIFGFELLMAPYAVAHFKLGMQLAGHDLSPTQREKWTYDFSGDERLGVYLTNTLEEAERKAETLFGPLRVITQEGNAAAKIKAELPILAVIGNPPYSGHSANRSWEVKRGKRELTFIGQLIQDYYTVDGRPLGEKNPKWLQDDYVKFIRWGQWRIEQTGAGILAFVTNHGYLDNPTFRGMRQSLMDAFTDIYLLNLHGNSKKKEKCPDGSSDENVFDIQQGVTLGIFVKDSGTGVPPVEAHGQDAHATRENHAAARVFHADLWGLREDKYKGLYGMDIGTTHWSELSPRSPDYLFIPQENALRAEYDAGWKITDVMPVNSVGVTTGRDQLCVSFDEKEALAKLREFTSEISEDELVHTYGLSNKSGWNIEQARKAIRRAGISAAMLHSYCYRPFDIRLLCLNDAIVGRTRIEVMGHMLAGHNLGLCTNRELNGQFRHALCSRHVVNDCAVSLQSRERTYLFPLYLYAYADEGSPRQAVLGVQPSQWAAGKAGRTPNLNPEFVADIETRLGLKFAPHGRGTGVPPVEPHGQDVHATHATIQIRQGAYLPHWTREGATYAVCFRLADSMPESVIEAWRFEREDTIKTARQMNRPLTAQEEQRLDHLFSERVEKFLDEGRGECWMRNNEVAAVVAGALKHFDGRRYQLLAWCVMPNHVHAVIQPLAGFELSQILHSWKSFSSKEANRVIVRNGPFWQPEYYDHLIRDENDFARQVEYVLANPLRAGLKNWKWVGCGTGVPPVETHGPEAHATAYAATFGPEDVFDYIYAVFYSPTYRARYAEFLKSDFPRVPLTSDVELFRALCGLGAQLVALHLLESPMLEKPIARYPVKGPNLVDKGFPKYMAPGETEPGTGKPLQEGRVYINRGTGVPPVNGPEAHTIKEAHGQDVHATGEPHGQDVHATFHDTGQYFEGVPPEVWNFHIGGYQVCEKWLKDRRGRTLTYDDLEHYRKVTTAIKETIRLMAEIDAAIPKWPIE